MPTHYCGVDMSFEQDLKMHPVLTRKKYPSHQLISVYNPCFLLKNVKKTKSAVTVTFLICFQWKSTCSKSLPENECLSWNKTYQGKLLLENEEKWSVGLEKTWNGEVRRNPAHCPSLVLALLTTFWSSDASSVYTNSTKHMVYWL